MHLGCSPVHLQVSPAALRRLLAVLAEALERALRLSSLGSAPQQSAALYSCLALLRLAKVGRTRNRNRNRTGARTRTDSHWD